MGKQAMAVKQSGYKAALLCGLIFCGVFLLMVFGLSALYHLEYLPQGREELLVRICLSVTAMFSAWAAGRHSVGQNMLMALFSTAVLLFFTLLVGVFTKTSAIFNISFLYNCAALISGGFIGAILSARKKKRRQSKRNITKRNHNR